jgi:hypothetical protein
MHVEFKKSSIPKAIIQDKAQFIPSLLLQESKAALCKRVLKLEQENEDLREDKFLLKFKLERRTASSSPPSPKDT